MNIILMGSKGAGKSTLGEALAQVTGLEAVDTDRQIEVLFEKNEGKAATCRTIFQTAGEDVFRELERAVATDVSALTYKIIVTGGGMMMDPGSRRLLRKNAILVFLSAEADTLWARATEKGLPPWLTGADGQEKFSLQVRFREEVLRPFADIVLDTTTGNPEELALQLADLIGEELAVRQTAASTYGDVIRMTGFGESHGRAIGTILEGIRPGIEFNEEILQEQLDRRRPGQSKVVTQRKESDSVEILSGVFEGKSTGAPIAMVIYNQDQRSHNYDNVKDVFRPGHGDFTFYKKYGFRDYRGGGRQSGRETACRVAAGAVPLKMLKEKGVRIVAHATQVAGIDAKTCDLDTIEQNPIRCADPVAAKAMEQAILDARSAKDSVGGVIQLEVTGLPVGLGDPIFGKLDARLCTAIMSIGAIKGVEVGGGFALCALRGSEANDSMKDGEFVSNYSGGILGGISTGAPLIMRVAVKPTASIAQKQMTYDEHDKNVEIEVLGRHDPCIVPRAVPVVEAMAALVILDAWEVQSRLNPEWAEKNPL